TLPLPSPLSSAHKLSDASLTVTVTSPGSSPHSRSTLASAWFVKRSASERRRGASLTQSMSQQYSFSLPALSKSLSLTLVSCVPRLKTTDLSSTSSSSRRRP